MGVWQMLLVLLMKMAKKLRVRLHYIFSDVKTSMKRVFCRKPLFLTKMIKRQIDMLALEVIFYV